jgi:hypothetical protein
MNLQLRSKKLLEEGGIHNLSEEMKVVIRTTEKGTFQFINEEECGLIVNWQHLPKKKLVIVVIENITTNMTKVLPIDIE